MEHDSTVRTNLYFPGTKFELKPVKMGFTISHYDADGHNVQNRFTATQMFCVLLLWHYIMSCIFKKKHSRKYSISWKNNTEIFDKIGDLFKVKLWTNRLWKVFISLDQNLILQRRCFAWSNFLFPNGTNQSLTLFWMEVCINETLYLEF